MMWSHKGEFEFWLNNHIEKIYEMFCWWEWGWGDPPRVPLPNELKKTMLKLFDDALKGDDGEVSCGRIRFDKQDGVIELAIEIG